MAKIPLRKKWISTSAWRGYEEYENTVFGGSILHGGSDPVAVTHNEKEKEIIAEVKKRLKKNSIPYRMAKGKTSNVFSSVYDIVVQKKDVPRAKKLLKDVV